MKAIRRLHAAKRAGQVLRRLRCAKQLGAYRSWLEWLEGVLAHTGGFLELWREYP